MKKFIVTSALLLAMILCLSTASAAGGNSFNPTLPNAVDQSATTWYASGTNRALLTVLLVGNVASNDVLGMEDVLQSMLLGSSYVGRSDGGSTLVVAGNVSGSCLTIAYSPLLGTAYYTMIDLYSAEAAIGQLCGSDYYQNSLSDIMEVVSALGNL